MEGQQLTIFDYMDPEKPKTDFCDMSEKEMVEYIGNETGMIFHHNDFLRQWEANYKRCVISLFYSTYYGSSKRFISAGVDKKYGDFHGTVRPCDSLEEAINHIKGNIRSIDEGTF
jgi:hypothetical protein